MRKQASPGQARHEHSPGFPIFSGQSPEGARQKWRRPFMALSETNQQPCARASLALGWLVFAPLVLIPHRGQSSVQALSAPRLRSRAGLRETLRPSAFTFDLKPWWNDRAAFDSIRIRNSVAGRHRSITAEKNPPHVARSRENSFGRSPGFRDEAVPVFEACDKCPDCTLRTSQRHRGHPAHAFVANPGGGSAELIPPPVCYRAD